MWQEVLAGLDIGERNRWRLERDVAYIERFAFIHLERIGLSLLKLIREGSDLVGPNGQGLAVEILLEPEATFAVRALGVHDLEAAATIAAHELSEGERRRISRKRLPSQSVHDPSGDGSNGRRSQGDRKLISTYPKIILYLPPNPLITPST